MTALPKVGRSSALHCTTRCWTMATRTASSTRLLPQTRAAYRSLLRYASHAVSHNRAATLNLRRAIRSQLESTRLAPGCTPLVGPQGASFLIGDASVAQKEESNAELEFAWVSVKDILGLFLASCRQDHRDMPRIGTAKADGIFDGERPSRFQTLARRLCNNVASLQYHHFSFHVAMSRRGGLTRVGGSNTLALRRRRSNPAPSTTGVPLEEVLPSLTVPAKPRRGPHLGPPEARSLRPLRWDGQTEAKRNGILQMQLIEAKMARLEAEARHTRPSQNQLPSQKPVSMQLVQSQLQELARQKHAAEKLLNRHEAHVHIAARARTLLEDALSGARGGRGLPLRPG